MDKAKAVVGLSLVWMMLSISATSAFIALYHSAKFILDKERQSTGSNEEYEPEEYC